MTPEQINTLQQKTRELNNSALLAAIRKLKESKTPSPEDQQAYIEELLKARLIVPVTIDENNTDTQDESDNKLKVQFSHLTNKDNQRFFMAFTDMQTLKKSAKDADKMQLIGLTYNDFASMLSDPKCKMMGFAINPFTENIVCGPNQAQVIGKYITSKKIQSGELTVISELEGIPEDVTRPIEQYFDARGDVKKAYLLGMRRGNSINRLIIADISEDVDFAGFAKDFSENVLKEMNDPAVPFMVMPFAEPAAKKATKEKVPFYVKV